jgi:hypothetical protein
MATCSNRPLATAQSGRAEPSPRAARSHPMQNRGHEMDRHRNHCPQVPPNLPIRPRCRSRRAGPNHWEPSGNRMRQRSRIRAVPRYGQKRGIPRTAIRRARIGTKVTCIERGLGSPPRRVFPFRARRQTIATTIVNRCAHRAHGIAQHSFPHLPRTLRQLVARRQPIPCRETIREGEGLEPRHSARGAVVAKAIAGSIGHESASIRKTEAHPLALGELELRDSKRMRKCDLDGVVGGSGATRFTPG